MGSSFLVSRHLPTASSTEFLTGYYWWVWCSQGCLCAAMADQMSGLGTSLYPRGTLIKHVGVDGEKGEGAKGDGGRTGEGVRGPPFP